MLIDQRISSMRKERTPSRTYERLTNVDVLGSLAGETSLIRKTGGINAGVRGEECQGCLFSCGWVGTA